jgi:hypothetical protein
MEAQLKDAQSTVALTILITIGVQSLIDVRKMKLVVLFQDKSNVEVIINANQFKIAVQMREIFGAMLQVNAELQNKNVV